METHIIPTFLNTDAGQEADKILRACVHCGFCTATCPTYLETGDELDSPRGRIYQIKEILEGSPPGKEIQHHLDRCLTCLNCTTTCPSGVEYNKLIEIGREFIESQHKRPFKQRLVRWGLRKVLPYPQRFSTLLQLSQWIKPLLPKTIQSKIPATSTNPSAAPSSKHKRKILLLQGCVQGNLTPETNNSTIKVLNKLAFEIIQPDKSGCCGAVSQHLSAPTEARIFMRNNIDAWWPHIQAGAEAILITASGCGLMIKEYGYHLNNDPEYADKARKVSSLAKDLCEIISIEDIKKLTHQHTYPVTRIAFHPPCTLQHGQKLMGKTEALLRATGLELLPVQDAHLCCGSAGTYSILQPELSQRLLTNKLQALQAAQPEWIVTDNVGCQTHLQTRAGVPVKHWVELFTHTKT